MASASPLSKPNGTLDSLPSVHSAPPSTRRLTGGASRESGRDAARDDLTDGTFYSTLNIDMKKQVSVGNMSVSPSSKDLVMASRKGLFIIDLDNPLKTPEFLPQGGMFDIADVQWNPHPSWSQYIISTSREKLLIWNLMSKGRTHIQHALIAHYRAITDVNWNNHEPSRLATCGIDSWIWLWDIREPTKPTGGLSPFIQTATQVKWNRRNSHLLASSHAEEVLVWDERKGTIPIVAVKAHDAIIYGIDWSRHSEYELSTCSLDKTVKFWDTRTTGRDEHGPGARLLNTIQTDYPVWRAKYVPFGRGVLTQPHRESAKLEMYRADNVEEPVHTFEGFGGVVKEYVWRLKGGESDSYDDREFQLITWSQDCVLRFWPMDQSLLEKVGFQRGAPITVPVLRRGAAKFSYRDMLADMTKKNPAITTPTHHSNILTSVKASLAPAPQRTTARTPSMQRQSPGLVQRTPPFQMPPQPAPPPANIRRSMTKGHGKGVRPAVDQIKWLSGVNVVHRREGSGERSDGSAGQSRSRARSRSLHMRSRARMDSTGTDGSSRDDESYPATLKEEITDVATRYSSSKVKIDNINLQQGTRSCAVALHVPQSIFVRILFSFPDDYPNGASPPNVDIDRNRDITTRKRASMLRSLRKILKECTLCIEPCIRYLLGLPDRGGLYTKPFTMDTDDEEDEIDVSGVAALRSGRGEGGTPSTRVVDAATAMLQQNQVPRERTSQGVFSANGTFVRIVLADQGRRSGISPHRGVDGDGENGSSVQRARAAQLSLALDGLRKMADCAPTIADGDPEAEADTPDFSDYFSTQPGVKRTGMGIGLWELKGVSLQKRGRRRSSVFIDNSFIGYGAFDRMLASMFVYHVTDPKQFCDLNAAVAAKYGRYDYQRILVTLSIVLKNVSAHPGEPTYRWGVNPMAKIIEETYQSLAAEKNVQMLAMFSMALLLADRSLRADLHRRSSHELRLVTSPSHSNIHAIPPTDYFSLRPRRRTLSSVNAHTERVPPPITIMTPPVPSVYADAETASPSPQQSPTVASGPKPSVAPWSSILYPRLLISGVSEASSSSNSSKQPQSNRSEPSTPAEMHPGSIPVPPGGRPTKIPSKSPRPPKRQRYQWSITSSLSAQAGSTDSHYSKPAPLYIPAHALAGARDSLPRSMTGQSKTAWSTATSSKVTITFTLMGNPQRHMTTAVPQERDRRPGGEPKKVVRMVGFEQTLPGDELPKPLGEPRLTQYVSHVRAYAELLFRAGLLEQRIEVLKIIPSLTHLFVDELSNTERDGLTLVPICQKCDILFPVGSDLCRRCGRGRLKAGCTVCRLPVRGLGRTCMSCVHVTHLGCWKEKKTAVCASGCGCKCPSHALDSAPTKIGR